MSTGPDYILKKLIDPPRSNLGPERRMARASLAFSGLVLLGLIHIGSTHDFPALASIAIALLIIVPLCHSLVIPVITEKYINSQVTKGQLKIGYNWEHYGDYPLTIGRLVTEIILAASAYIGAYLFLIAIAWTFDVINSARYSFLSLF